MAIVKPRNFFMTEGSLILLRKLRACRAAQLINPSSWDTLYLERAARNDKAATPEELQPPLRLVRVRAVTSTDVQARSDFEFLAKLIGKSISSFFSGNMQTVNPPNPSCQ
ncbi:MAG TPA: hypothetical protein VGC91_01300 [Pyrinomonadaceae bacterium]|jgi:hypothetical protein